MSDKGGAPGKLNGLTMVCYHYVRELKKSSYPAIHGLEYQKFKDQLDCLARDYEPVMVEDVVAAVRGERDLPENGMLLTFDDGYLDHYSYVLPELMTRKLSGLFFVPVAVIHRRHVLDVNKIHFIIAAVKNISDVVDELSRSIEHYQKEYSLLSVSEYKEKWAHAGRYDNAETMFIKRMFQRGLPDPVRSVLLTELFQRFVCQEEDVFATGLYMNYEQVRTLKLCGMSIGSHGVSHRWFTELSNGELQSELDESWRFLESLGEAKGHAAICYPYGGYSNEVLSVIRNNDFAFGVTVESRKAIIGHDDEMLLPRLDTNDIPIV